MNFCENFHEHLALSGVESPEHSHFFETLKSARHLALVSEVSTALAVGLPPLPGDWRKCVPELAAFEVYAGDGHFHAAAHDPRKAGVLADELASTSQGVSVRRVRYCCARRAEEFCFLTNECTLPPRVIAHLYRLRWEIEKTFDKLKNTLGEIKAWASSANAKTTQAHFLCMVHNLMIRGESELEQVHGIRNEVELAQRA